MDSTVELNRKCDWLFAGGSALLLGIFAAPANAQVAPKAAAIDQPTSAPPSAADPQADTAADRGRIDDIVVTAQRRSERLQSVPAAISAYSDKQLAQAGVENTRDLQLVTPSLSFVQSTFTPQPTIRGIGTRGANPGDEEVVPTYLDGVYQPFITGGLFELSNIERVEVLKGPQGTLLGRNATGGAINIITTRPSFQPTGKFSLSYGSFDEVQASGYLSAGSGPIAGSIVTQYVRDDGYVRELTSGKRTASQDNFLVRGKLLFVLSSQTELTVAGSYFNRKDTTVAPFPLNGNSVALQSNPNVSLAFTDRTTRLTQLPAVSMSQSAVSATLVHHFSGATLTSIFGYSDNRNVYSLDLDLSPSPISIQSAHQYDRGWTEELFLTSSGTSKFTWIVGGFYINDDSGFNPRTVNTAILNAQLLLKGFAFYAQGAYKLTDKLTATVGGRYSNDRKCGAADNGIGTQRLVETCKRWTSFDPSVTIDYQFSPRAKIYARYAQAFKAGVYNATAFSPIPVNPERVRSYELGLKSDPASWLRVNLAGWYTDYKDIQVNTRDPVSNTVILQNAAAARIYGAEGEIVLRPVQGLNVRLGGSLMSAKYLEYLNAQVFVPRVGGGNVAAFIDAKGKPLLRTPQTSANASVDYTFPLFGGNLTTSANMYYQGYMNFTLDGRIRQPGYALVNAQIAWRSNGDRYEVALWGKNLTGVDVPLQVIGTANGDFASYMRPATGGVRVTAKF